jgi:hypothetical protein
MEKLVEQLDITRLSKSHVSEMAKDHDSQSRRFGPGRWTPGPTPSSLLTRSSSKSAKAAAP